MRGLDRLGAAILNAVTAVPPHDCGECVDRNGSCLLCRRRALYFIEHLRQRKGRR